MRLIYITIATGLSCLIVGVIYLIVAHRQKISRRRNRKEKCPELTSTTHVNVVQAVVKPREKKKTQLPPIFMINGGTNKVRPVSAVNTTKTITTQHK